MCVVFTYRLRTGQIYTSLSHLLFFISLNVNHLHIEKVKVSLFMFENIAAQVHFLNLMEVAHEAEQSQCEILFAILFISLI